MDTRDGRIYDEEMSVASIENRCLAYHPKLEGMNHIHVAVVKI